MVQTIGRVFINKICTWICLRTRGKERNIHDRNDEFWDSTFIHLFLQTQDSSSTLLVDLPLHTAIVIDVQEGETVAFRAAFTSIVELFLLFSTAAVFAWQKCLMLSSTLAI